MPAAGTLQDWIRQQLAAGLPALAGARVVGTVPVQVELLNQLLADFLAEAARPGEARAAGSGLPIDVAALARLVRRARIDATPGVVTLDFEVGVDG